MLTARKYQNRASKLVILSIGSRLKDNAFDLPVPCEIGHGFEPSSFMFLSGIFAFRRRVRRTADQRDSAELLSGAVRRSFKARNGKFESTSLGRRVGRTLTGVRIRWVSSRENRTSGTPHWTTRSSSVW